MNIMKWSPSFTPLFLLFLILMLPSCLSTQKGGVKDAVEVDTTSSACRYIAEKLQRETELRGRHVQVTDANIKERQSGGILPYSAVIDDGLTREFSRLGASVSVRRGGPESLIVIASYSKSGDMVIIDVKLRRIGRNMQSFEVGVAEAALPASSLDSTWLQPTLATQSESLVRQLASNYTGMGFRLNFSKSMPGVPGQPSLLFSRQFDLHLQKAVSTTQLLPVSKTGRREVTLRSSYTLSEKSIHLKAWLENSKGGVLAIATSTLDSYEREWLRPMASISTSACIEYDVMGATDLPADSPAALHLQKYVRQYISELGVKIVKCGNSNMVSRVAISITQHPTKTTKDGYTFSPVEVRVAISDGEGGQKGEFGDQATRAFSSSKGQALANKKSVEKIALSKDGNGKLRLKQQLATALLSVDS